MDFPPIPENEFVIYAQVHFLLPLLLRELTHIPPPQLQSKPNTGDQLEHYLRLLIGLAQREPGTLDYVISRDPEATDLFHVYEKYTGREAFEAHIAAKEFKDFVDSGLLAVPPTPKMLKPLKPL